MRDPRIKDSSNRSNTQGRHQHPQGFGQPGIHQPTFSPSVPSTSISHTQSSFNPSYHPPYIPPPSTLSSHAHSSFNPSFHPPGPTFGPSSDHPFSSLTSYNSPHNIPPPFQQLNRPPSNPPPIPSSSNLSSNNSLPSHRPPNTPTSIQPPPAPPFLFPRVPYDLPAFQAQTFQPSEASYAARWSTPPLTATPSSPAQQCSTPQCQAVPGSQVTSDSQAWVDNWLKSKWISNRMKEPIKPSIKIYKVKEKLKLAMRLIRELENAARTLNVMAKTVTTPEWDQKCDEVERNKLQLTDVLEQLRMNPEDINTFKAKYSKRLKKRSRLKRQAERYKREKEEARVRRQNSHIHIDNWQKEMQEEVERSHREERLQREADGVLWGVTLKKAEARRQVALLAALLELRQVRVQRLIAAGRAVSQGQIDTFNTVIERLQKMWTRDLEECQLEEQALRGMLNEAVIKSDPVKTFKKLVLREWELALFGTVGSLDSNLRGEQLIQLRREWDQFAVKPPAVLASTIPPGCLLPVPPSDDEWRALLKY